MEFVDQVEFGVLDPLVASLDLTRIKWKLTDTQHGFGMDPEICDLAEREYRRFLSLKRFYPGLSLVPNKLIDKFWHMHILDTAAYREDCDAMFGRFIDHYPYFGMHGKEDQNDLERAFQRTIKLYEKHFGPVPEIENEAARCEEHACHVPSECACRTPEACR